MAGSGAPDGSGEGIGRDRDVYGRKLRIVLVDRESVKDTLVGGAYAVVWEGAATLVLA
jgi:hypothetical protein